MALALALSLSVAPEARDARAQDTGPSFQLVSVNDGGEPGAPTADQYGPVSRWRNRGTHPTDLRDGSDDGRFFVFSSPSANLVGSGEAETDDVFVRDRAAGTTGRVNTTADGRVLRAAFWSSISADGRYVAFDSAEGADGAADQARCDEIAGLYVKDRTGGGVVAVTPGQYRPPVSPDDTAGCRRRRGNHPVLNAPGTALAFTSFTDWRNPDGDPLGFNQAWVYDLDRGEYDLLSAGPSGQPGGGDHANSHTTRQVTVSADGRRAVFAANLHGLSDLAEGDAYYAYLRDRDAGTTEIVSVDWRGEPQPLQPPPAGFEQPTLSAGGGASISDGGRHVVFASQSADMVPGGPADGARHVYVRDLAASTTELVSVDGAGNPPPFGASHPSISGDGRWVAFASFDGTRRLWLHDREEGTSQVVVDPAADPELRLNANSSGSVRLSSAATFLTAVWDTEGLGYQQYLFPLEPLELDDTVELVALEVTQAVQSWTNSIPLVKWKRTVVRAFVEVPPGAEPRWVSGRLHGIRDGRALPGGPLRPVRGSVLVTQRVVQRRADLQASIDFVLPGDPQLARDWTHGQVTLRFDAGDDIEVTCREAAGPTAGDCAATVTFEDMAPAEIKFVAVPYIDDDGNLQEPSLDDLQEQLSRVEDLFPVPWLQTISGRGHSIAYGRLDVTYLQPPDLMEVNHALTQQRLADGCEDAKGCRTLYYGVLLGAHGTLVGLAAGIPGDVSSGYTRGLDRRTDVGEFRNVAGHEIAHTLGVSHAVDDARGLTELHDDDGNLVLDADGNPISFKTGPCGEAASPSARGHPHFGRIAGAQGERTAGLLGARSNQNTEVWGFNTSHYWNDRLAVVDPHETGALMGYCWVGSANDTWTAEHEWGLLRAALRERFPTSAASLGQAQSVMDGPHLLVSGIVDLETAPPGVELTPVLEASEGFAAPPAGDYTVRVLSSSGATLQEVAFEPTVQHARSADGTHPPETALFVVPVPKPTQPYARLEVRRDGTLLTAADASASAPQITVTAPAAGSVQDGDDLVVAWDASDADGDDLTFTVRYARVCCDTWQTVALNVPGGTRTFPRLTLPGGTSDAVVEVIASDGVLTATARSGPFTVADRPPDVAITSPPDGHVVPSSGALLLEARTHDAEDGVAAVTWHSDRDGRLASEPTAVLLAGDLSVGVHTLTATATDSADNTASDSIAVVVAGACGGQAVPPAGFTDIDANTHEAAIDCVAWHDVARGTSATTYAPTAPVRRDQMASFLARMVERAGGQLPAGTQDGFTDIAGNTHEAAIRRLAAAGIVLGTSATTYSPAATVARDQMASFLTRTYEYLTNSTLPAPASAFTDVAGNAHEAAINKAAAGFALGTSPTTYSPRDPVRRDQMASFLTRVLERLAADGRRIG